MSARSKARKRALDLIFAAEARGMSVDELLSSQVDAGEAPSNEYTVTLVRGVHEKAARLDELISTYAEGWTIERLPAVDRNVLRLGIYELLYVDDVPDAVAVSEAVNLARDLSTDESPGFVNGILASVTRDKERLLA
ncbi:transcription antitermination factor NusB [Nocardioides marmoriginsengisoli]|uniref:Transcription antitermination protein NusB n=1 Tax=Nocardioides marmoriginsengisoli TaxID=661483 RepID=A0A3N0CKX9_9ACTN|nr:transcription antitermination factor NusB [Nocardioides marmoriginsengisoli]RNL64114.1 transcription antitermination factor NusB [Nocardioides marmoriginsengisoli]